MPFAVSNDTHPDSPHMLRLLLTGIPTIMVVWLMAIVFAQLLGGALHGDEITFMTLARDGGADTYQVDLNTQITMLFPAKLTLAKPAWSPDGERFAYVPYMPGKLGGIALADPSGRYTSWLVDSTWDSPANLVWSPQGDALAFNTSNWQIWMVSANGSESHLILSDLTAFFPSWSPDGQQVAFQESSHLYVIQRDGSQRRELATYLLVEQLDWSPDGRRIVFSAYDPRVPLSSSSLYTVEVSTNEVQQLTLFEKNCAYHPAWAPDSRRIAFENPCGDPAGIYEIDADTSQVRLLVASTQRIRFPLWRP